jgi:hypothetical protein
LSQIQMNSPLRRLRTSQSQTPYVADTSRGTFVSDAVSDGASHYFRDSFREVRRVIS